jgi:hypothetical protein
MIQTFPLPSLRMLEGLGLSDVRIILAGTISGNTMKKCVGKFPDCVLIDPYGYLKNIGVRTQLLLILVKSVF